MRTAKPPDLLTTRSITQWSLKLDANVLCSSSQSNLPSYILRLASLAQYSLPSHKVVEVVDVPALRDERVVDVVDVPALRDERRSGKPAVEAKYVLSPTSYTRLPEPRGTIKSRMASL